MRLLSTLLPVSVLLQGASSVHVADDGPLATRDIDQILRSVEARGFVEDIWDKIEDASTCAGCQVCRAFALTHVVCLC